MAKRKSSLDLLGLLAFVVLLISGICFVLNFFKIGNGMLPTIAQISLVIVVLWCAWNYACKLSKTWRIIYFILAILVIVGLVLGFNII